MSFGKKDKKTTPKGWVCGCGIQLPHYLLYCSRCGQGQPKKGTEK